MSPLVQRPRTGSARPNPSDQHWGMLLFESMSAGVLAIFVGFIAVLCVVGVYVVIVWPLTFWDLTNLGIEKFFPWTNTVLWSVFAGGALAGYWCFSGHAFKATPKAKIPARSTSKR